MIDPESQPIIVLGVERSGTSAVAEMAHRWGAYAGPFEKLHQADAHAPRGYWEFLPLWDLLAELGDFDAGATWWDHDFQQRMEKKATDPAFRKKAADLMAEIEPELWRNNCGIPFEQVAEATSEQKALYAFVRRKIDDPFAPFDVAQYPLPPGYLEFLNVQEALLKAYRELEHQ